MSKHESSVNFENLIKDLADMYPFDVGTVVLIEVVANALDSNATLIEVAYDSKNKSLVVTDNGTGMSQDDFDQYHDFAAGLKTRGMGIGFAGVGAKISFNVAAQVVTETRSSSFSGGSNWYLESTKKLVWEEITPKYLTTNGTRVNILFSKDTSLPFNDTASIISILRQHFLPLFDHKFLTLYNELKFYSSNLRFVINGKEITPISIINEYNLNKILEFFPTNGNTRIGYGLFGVAPTDYPLGENLCGVLLCTHGKVIKADLFNQFPGDLGPKIMGIVEVPNFIQFLTSSKTDFIRRKRLKEFEKLYDPIRQEFKLWLKNMGVESSEIDIGDEVKKIEKELSKLIDDIPELGEFFGYRVRKQILAKNDNGEVLADNHEGTEATYPIGQGTTQGNDAPLDIGDDPGNALRENLQDGSVKATPISRKGRKGPKVSFSDLPERIDTAWVDGNAVVINAGHPAYKKIVANATACRMYCLNSIANAIQKFLFTGQPDDLMFTDKMMAAWGNK